MSWIWSLILLVITIGVGYILYDVYDDIQRSRRRESRRVRRDEKRRRHWQSLRDEGRPRYPYADLGDPDSKNIRLIELLPSKKIHFGMRVSSLQEGQIEDYEALSYCWGSAEDSHPITWSDGSIIWIPQSLHSALMHLTPKSGSRLIWADALCINQEDPVEKSWQVRQMNLVYKHAKSVLIYLGEDEDDSDELRDFIPRLLRAKKLVEDKEGPILYVFDINPALMKESGMPHPIWDFQIVSTFMQLRQRKWFQRVWIIQELLMAKECTLICGRWECAWTDFLTAMDFVIGCGMIMDISFQGQGISHYEVLQTSRNSWAESPFPWNIREVLERHRISQATNPVDHVYALLGLANDGQAIDIDYAKSPAEVFLETATYIFRNSNDLGHLNFSGISGQISGTSLPSWVPDWSRTPESFPLTMYLADVMDLRYIGRFQTLKKAVKSCHTISHCGLQLCLSGFKIDTVCLIGPCAPPAPSSTRHTMFVYLEFFHTLSEWARLARADVDTMYKPTGEQKRAVFWTTLQADSSWDRIRLNPHSLPVRTVRNLSRSMRWVKKLLQPLCGWPAPRYCTLVAFWLFLLPYILYSLAFERRDLFSSNNGSYLHSISRSYGRRFFTTQPHSGYMGLGPSTLQLDDEVWVLKGGLTPYILRPTYSAADEYRIVGECWIYGLMNGEAGDGRVEHSIKLI